MKSILFRQIVLYIFLSCGFSLLAQVKSSEKQVKNIMSNTQTSPHIYSKFSIQAHTGILNFLGQEHYGYYASQLKQNELNKNNKDTIGTWAQFTGGPIIPVGITLEFKPNKHIFINLGLDYLFSSQNNYTQNYQNLSEAPSSYVGPLLSGVLLDALPYLSDTRTAFNVTYNSTMLNTFNIRLAAGYTTNLSYQFSLQAGLQINTLLTQLRNVEYINFTPVTSNILANAIRANDYTTYIKIYQKTDVISSLGFSAFIGMRYHISPRWYVGLQGYLSYFNAPQKVDFPASSITIEEAYYGVLTRRKSSQSTNYYFKNSGALGLILSIGFNL